jgi:hypothetical protein
MKGNSMRCAIMSLLLGLSGTVFAVPGVPPEFLGDWVPRSSTCQSQLRLRVEATRAILINGSQSKSFGNLDFCYSCEGGAQYSGIVVWMAAEFDGKTVSPFMVQFNAGEKAGVAKLDLQKPDLKQQFPLHQVALKRCIKKT